MKTLLLCVALFAPLVAQSVAAEVAESTLKVPVRFQDAYRKQIERDIVVTVFEEPGRERYPLLLINHGRPVDDAGRMRFGRARFTQAARHFAALGYSVWVPTRVGYGESGIDEDPEYTGPCNRKRYPPAYEAAAEQVLQVIAHAALLPRIDARKVVVIGQSFGGATSVALAARGAPTIAVTINFAGGGGGDPVMRPAQPCYPAALEEMFGGYGKTARVPTLWVYAENDRYFGAKLPRAWYEAFRANGGVGELAILPPFGEDGHLLFSRGLEVWKPVVERFLAAHDAAGARR